MKYERPRDMDPEHSPPASTEAARKVRGRSPARRAIRLSLLFLAGGLLSGLAVLKSGCVPGGRAVTLGGVIDGFVITGIEIENPRFEPVGLSPEIRPARTYWLRSGNEIIAKWDTFEWHYTKEGEMCTFPDNTSSSNCLVCDFCNLPSNTDGPPCLGAFFNGPFIGLVSIVAFPGFVESDDPELVFDYIGGADSVRGTCGTPRFQQPRFTPDQSALFRFKAGDESIVLRGEFDGEARIHVVDAGPARAQTTAYQLSYQVVDGRDYWRWNIEGDGSILMENFSPELRITGIRILRGTCADGSAEGRECSVPSEAVPVKASRILFLPDFRGSIARQLGEAAHRCYSIPSTTGDTFLDLDHCRPVFDPSSNTESPKLATPVYEIQPPQADVDLTWFVEFNTAEGADADLTTPGVNDPMPNDAQLIIEFTIQAG